MAERYRSALTTDSFMAADVAVVVGQYNKIGERKIEAGEILSLGWGDQSGQNDAVGRIFLDLRSNAASPGAEVNGTLRFHVLSPQRRPIKVLGEYRTEVLRTGSGDRTKQVPFPEMLEQLPEDRILVIEFLPDAAVTIGKANTKMIIDATYETTI